MGFDCFEEGGGALVEAGGGVVGFVIGDVEDWRYAGQM